MPDDRIDELTRFAAELADETARRYVKTLSRSKSR